MDQDHPNSHTTNINKKYCLTGEIYPTMPPLYRQKIQTAISQASSLFIIITGGKRA
jgi:hypothetical protein